MCPVCTSPSALAYNNIWAASCNAGHQFDRCKLSLLPIVDLTWQKTCADCGLQFFDEYKHPGMKIGSTTNRDHVIHSDTLDSTGSEVEPSSTGETRWTYFANHLFVEFDRCPYCEGNFTG